MEPRLLDDDEWSKSLILKPNTLKPHPWFIVSFVAIQPRDRNPQMLLTGFHKDG